MNERRPPAPPAAPRQRRPSSSLESTVLAPHPADVTAEALELLSERDLEDADADLDDDVFDGGPTHTMRQPPKVTRTVSTPSGDISVIEARELRPAPSDAGFDGPPQSTFFGDDARAAFGDEHEGAALDEFAAPSTEVLRLAFSEPGDELVDDAEPVAVKKWRAGHGASPADVAARPVSPPGTRVDAVPAGARHVPFDVDELRRTLEEAEKLLGTVKHMASSLDLDLVAPGARGMNAQLAAALHRLGEALAMLGR